MNRELAKVGPPAPFQAAGWPADPDRTNRLGPSACLRCVNTNDNNKDDEDGDDHQRRQAQKVAVECLFLI